MGEDRGEGKIDMKRGQGRDLHKLFTGTPNRRPAEKKVTKNCIYLQLYSNTVRTLF